MSKSTGLLMSLFLLVCSSVAAGQEMYDPEIPRELIVRLVAGSDVNAFEADMNALVSPQQVTRIDEIPSRDVYVYQWPFDLTELYINSNIVSRPDVIWAEMNYTSQAAEGRVRDFFTGSTQDPDSYTTQWAWSKINLDYAQQFASGNNQLIAVLDTGVDAAHSALQGHLTPGWNFVDNNADTADVGDNADNDGDGDFDEMVGHGTFITGIITRMAPDALVLPVKVLNSDGRSDLVTVGKGLFYALDNNASVINVSLGSTWKSDLWDDAVSEAKNRGVIIVGAAGNQDYNFELYFEYPAMFRDVIGVGSTDEADIKSLFSNYSACQISDPHCDERDQITLVTPGNNIYSTIPDGQYARWNGTSMSSAMVSATVSLILSQHPEWPRNESLLLIVKNKITSSAVNIDGINPLYAGLLGAGRLDLSGAVDLIIPGDLDGDGDVDQADLGLLLAAYQQNANGDLDGDGDTDQADLGILLANFGAW
ncbi:MAG TPA: hypothetical protein ENJ06_06665 [Phycisphaeraceae bacterium]|nr:hypothetical protein [Phycisphaeraceae bacterium]